MKLDLISESTLKITLSADDMSNYDLQYDRLCKPEENRRTFSRLLSELRKQKPDLFLNNAFANEKRLLVEAFPRCDGGCMLYVSALYQCSEESCKAAGLICELFSYDELEQLCRLLCNEKTLAGIHFSSSLYQSGGAYRLLVTPENTCHRHIRRFFSEYGEVLDKDSDAAVTGEHFRLLLSGNAAERIAGE